MENNAGDERDTEIPPDGLYCFIDRERECGAECMAYLPAPSEDKGAGLSIQQRSCAIIVSAERIGRFMSGLVQIGLRRQQEAKVRADDAERDRIRNAPIPTPRGT